MRLGDDEGRRALLVDGVVQSVAVEDAVGGYWPILLPNVRPKQALILGLGGGTIVHLLRRRFGDLTIVGLEADPDVLALARNEFALDQPGLEIRHEDAFGFVTTCRDRFDYLCVDLFRGNRPEPGMLSRPFLRNLKALATPGAEIAFNLFHDRRTPTALNRLARVLTIRSTERIGKNVVVKAGVR